LTISALHTAGLSIIHGIPLGEEQGIGALTLGGYLRKSYRGTRFWKIVKP
jgi:fatty-acyl-CoA synthase